jgi:HEAT repeat protein
MFGVSEDKIAKWGEKGKAANLVKAAGSKKENLRLAAAKAMGNVDDEQVYNSLIALLRDRNPEIRMAVLDSLRKLNNKNAIEYVRGLVSDTDAKVSEMAKQVLKDLHK